MATLPENDEWVAGITQLETTTRVLGGPGGPSNAPQADLASRTLWLKNRLTEFISSTQFRHPPSVFSVPGTYAVTMPDGIYSTEYEAWGAASGGAIGATAGHGEGGSSGGHCAGVINAHPGTILNIIIGAGSDGLIGTGNVVAGGDTVISWESEGMTHTITAGGGQGAVLVSEGGAPGVGGAANGGDINMPGQSGTDGTDNWFGIGGAAPRGGFGGLPAGTGRLDGGWPGGGGGSDPVRMLVGKGANGGIIFKF